MLTLSGMGQLLTHPLRSKVDPIRTLYRARGQWFERCDNLRRGGLSDRSRSEKVVNLRLLQC